MLGRLTGGVHPPESKEETAGLPVEDLPVSQTLVVPMQQHIGAPARPAVEVGDAVARGTLLGEPGGFVSAAVHSPVSGKVAAIEDRMGAMGRRGTCVIVENDGEDRWADGCNIERATDSLDPDAIRKVVADAGLVGMGGATFPMHVKLSPPENKPIDVLLVNGAECEPYLTGDHRLMLEDGESIVAGAELAARAVGAGEVVLAVEDNKPDAFEALTKAAARFECARVVMLPTRYPQGAEKQLIEVITSRQVPSGGLPMDVGVLVQNVSTCAALWKAARFNRPLTERITTVTGPCVANPANLRVRVGTPYSDIFKRVGLVSTPERIVSGGPMMGIAQLSVDIPVTKGTSGLLLLDRVPSAEFRACIRCGKCVLACPVSLVPSQISVLLEAGRVDEATDYDMLDCIECGCCTYVCPSKRPIVNWVKIGKAELREQRARERKA